MKRNRRPVVKHVKSECVGTSSSNPDNNSGRDAGEDGRATSDSCNESVADRRVLRSRYLALKTLILGSLICFISLLSALVFWIVFLPSLFVYGFSGGNERFAF